MIIDGRFLKLNKIGQGAYGNVYTVYQLDNDKSFNERLFALKMIRISDISLSNILFDQQGKLKISDFGLSKKYIQNKFFQKNIAARTYRPPEILFGSNQCIFQLFIDDMSVDIWSLGCVIAEIFLESPIFDGKSDIEQLGKIIDIMGTPIENDWEEAKNLPYYMEFKSNQQKLKNILIEAPQEIIQLIEQMLQLNPKKRITTQQILKNKIFQNNYATDYVFYIQQLYNQNLQKLQQIKDQKQQKL